MVAVADAAEPLTALGVNTTRRLAQPIESAGQQLASRSFDALVRQVKALPSAGGERERPLQVLQPRVPMTAAAGEGGA